MVEPLAVGLHAVMTAALTPGDDVLVLGGGPVGAAVACWAKVLGAREVIVSDPVEHRRTLALALGATGTIDPAVEEVDAAFAKLAGRAPRTVFECVGKEGMLQAAAGHAVRGGQILSAGMCMQPDPIMPLVMGVKELTIRFVSYYRHADFKMTCDMLGAGRIDASPMVTDRIGLDALPDAFEALRRPSTQCKVLVQP